MRWSYYGIKCSNYAFYIAFEGFLQTTADEFCYYYARKDGGLCFPDFPRKQIRGPASNYLDQMEEYDKVEEISRFIKINTP